MTGVREGKLIERMTLCPDFRQDHCLCRPVAAGSRRIHLERIPGEPMTFLQNEIDLPLGFAAVAGGWTGSQGRHEFGLVQHFAPGVPAGQALGLARDCVERVFDGGQAAAQLNRTHAAIRLFRAWQIHLVKQVKWIAGVGFHHHENRIFGWVETKCFARVEQAKRHGARSLALNL